ncbi:MAG: hypothetical protein SAJ37_18570 [Oscillatoria sp. PMC 1068.18]|nr:hypothetical protein [Oscillatoria sp. PMC 1076.18]MEC4990741.1 hypothetical protein [Oscillatoria sp. PMC 1068.18]
MRFICGKYILATFAVINAIATASNAAIVGLYDFEGDSLTPSSVDSNLSFSNFSYTGPGTTNFFAGNPGDAYSSNNWAAGTIDLGRYFQFSIDPNPGFEVTLNSLELDERRSGTGPTTWEVRSSLDNYASTLSLFNVPDNTDFRANQTTNFSSTFTGLTNSVTFRIYGYNAESGVGTWRLDNVEVDGIVNATATAVPFEFSPGLGLLILGVWLTGFQLKNRQKTK